MCGGSVGAGTRLCVLQEWECKTMPHGKTSGQYRISLLTGNVKVAWVVVAPPASRAQKSAYLQLFLTQEVL